MSELIYTRVGDCYIPNLKLSGSRRHPWQVWRMHQKYLEEYRPVLYNSLLLSEKLYPHLLEIDKVANERMDILMPQLMKAVSVTEERKAVDQMKWVRLVNNFKAQVEEIIYSELIFE